MSAHTTGSKPRLAQSKSTSAWMRGRLGMNVHTGDWKERLYLPAYQVKAAASYASVASQTVRNWQKASGEGAALGPRDRGVSLSYLQLQELAIVAAMRKLKKIQLSTIRTARDYLARKLHTTYPFADKRVTSDGQDILLDLKDELPNAEAEAMLVANKGGQLAWSEVIGKRFEQFEYEKGLALKWHLSEDKKVVIDPRISFGAPAVRGVATWVLRARELAGESVEEIAEDFNLKADEVRSALQFEHSLQRSH